MSKFTSNIVTVIQARIASSRLPHKVMMCLAGKPLLLRLYERVKASRLSGTVVIATTTTKEDDAIVDLCKRENIEVFRGHETDLLDRHFKVAMKYDADAIVKIPSDCPLIDPAIIDKVLQHYILNCDEFDYVSNLHPATYPDGNDVEILSVETLKNAWINAKNDYEREHTTPYIWDNPQRFRIGNVIWETAFDYSMTHRWTIDYEEDFHFIFAVYKELYSEKPLFNLYDILNLLDRKPHIANINKKYLGANWYRNHIGQLATIKMEQTKVI